MACKIFLLLLLSSCYLSIVNGQTNPHCVDGRQTIVHLFEWKWSQIALECERFLAPYGYCGVQTSVPTANAIVRDPPRPWWERYQPASYSLNTRSGTEAEFQDMVRRCNNVGVRIFPDIVINHMTGGGTCCSGTDGCDFNGGNFSFPCVPYGRNDFNVYGDNCPNPNGGIDDWGNRDQIRNCELLGLRDLKLGTTYVRDKVRELLNRMISYGVGGFRVDAAKHMWPGDLHAIFDSLNDLNTAHGFAPGSRLYLFQEVIQGSNNEAIVGSEYFSLGAVTEFRYGVHLSRIFRGRDMAKWLINWGPNWEMHPDPYALVFLDNHDNQRGHGGGEDVLTFRDSRDYKKAVSFGLAHPYGRYRVMSSYNWEPRGDDWIGPPSTNEVINDVPINPNLSCGGGWICEHRQIYNMVRFRRVTAGAGVNDWWDNGFNQIAFCRGDRGFYTINNDGHPLVERLQTCLPAGTYCDIISGNKEGNSCTGKSVTVEVFGWANINISNTDVDPMLAIHVDSRLD